MSERQLSRAVISDFKGLLTNADPLDLKAGQSTVQINCGGPVPGKLRTRAGLVFVDFSGGNGGSAHDVVVGAPFNGPYGDFIVYQRSNGDVIAGKAPA